MNDQGFPSSAKRNSGSKLIFLPAVMANSAAGLPSVRLGIVEIPLLVIVTVPPK
jgi:hypothetical protein